MMKDRCDRINFILQPVDKHMGSGVERLPELCDLLPSIRGEQKVDDMVIEVLLAAQVLVDQAANDGGSVGKLHHFGLVVEFLHYPLAMCRFAGPVKSFKDDEQATAAA